jgi:hypothetical protein
MDRVFFFDFESRTWSSRMCKDVLPSWVFGHATKRGRSIFAFGSPRGESGTLEVRGLPVQEAAAGLHTAPILLQYRCSP